MKRIFTAWFATSFATSFAASFATLIMSSVAPALCSPIENDVVDSAEEFEKLEERVRVLEAIVQALQNDKANVTGKDVIESQPRRGVSDADIIIQVISFTKASVEPALTAIVAEVETRLKADEALLALAKVAEQKLLEQAEHYGERSQQSGSTNSTSRSQSASNRSQTVRTLTEDEYKRAMDQNKSQRKKITSEIIELSNKVENSRRLVANKRRNATPQGQRIVGVTSAGARIIVTTRSNCSKVLEAGVEVKLMNPRSVECDENSTEYEADRVERTK
jgi:cell division protein FtsB